MILLSPKSVTLRFRSFVSKRFRGLKSRWMIGPKVIGRAKFSAKRLGFYIFYHVSLQFGACFKS